ncbi:hypothetical protein [Pseudomonas juntendi]|uniref:hypothetical protein n=1 Tax=Pseudomonas juntendi TaxID=2666183 RepID=UPI001F2AE018|nr:hypothetical protein [Pseudomonas juntendi]
MPTQNQSSNTELSKIVTEALVGMVSGVTGMKPPTDEPLPGFIQAPIDRAVTRISGLLAQPAPQPHPEPIAWMVGTAFWWTKEEAERDAAETGLPIVGLGPIACAAPTEHHRGETPVPEYHREALGIDDAVRSRLTLIAREAAISCTHRYNYMPTTPEDALSWEPHSWVLGAMRMVELGKPVDRERMTFEYVHADGERRSVSLSREEVAGYMDEFLFEKLTETLCQCEPIGETNVVDCRCDEVAEQFSLVKPS